MPEDNVAKYSVEIVKSYENEALVYQMELEEYIDQELQMTKKDFSICVTMKVKNILNLI